MYVLTLRPKLGESVQKIATIHYLNPFKLTPGAAGSGGEGSKFGLLLCESGIELAPGFFQSGGGRLWVGAPETCLPLGSTLPTLGLSLDDAAVLVDVTMVVVVGILGVADLVVVGELSDEMVIEVLVVGVLVVVVAEVVAVEAVEGLVERVVVVVVVGVVDVRMGAVVVVVVVVVVEGLVEVVEEVVVVVVVVGVVDV